MNQEEQRGKANPLSWHILRNQGTQGGGERALLTELEVKINNVQEGGDKPLHETRRGTPRGFEGGDEHKLTLNTGDLIQGNEKRGPTTNGEGTYNLTGVQST